MNASVSRGNTNYLDGVMLLMAEEGCRCAINQISQAIECIQGKLREEEKQIDHCAQEKARLVRQLVGPP